MQATVNQSADVNQPQIMSTGSWAFFDRIYCITLKSRPDRRERARKQFAAAGLGERVEFVVVTKHPVNQEEGIFQSHRLCLTRGLRAGARNILVFEDDVFFARLDPRVLREAGGYLDSGVDWNGLFLGCITDGSSRTGRSHVARIVYRCLAHAYALNRPFAEQLVRQPWSGIPFDELLRRHQADFYAIYPMCAFQGLAGSDNRTVAIDRMRRICGGLPFIQRMNELYQNHKKVLLPGSIAVVLAVVLLTLRLW
jgi:glycosyl transferase, family 25